MTAQDLSLGRPLTAARPSRHVDAGALRQWDWGLLAVLALLSTVLAAVFYRFTLLLAVDGTGGVVASLAISVVVHGALVARTVARHRAPAVA